MADLFDNPMGTTGSSSSNTPRPTPKLLRTLFERMGFPIVARHRSKNVTLHTPGRRQLRHQRRAGQLWPALCATARSVRLRDGVSRQGRREGVQARVNSGAKPVTTAVGPMELSIPAIEGIGGSIVYLVDRYGEHTIYDVDFVPGGAVGLAARDRTAAASTT
jgi:4-hydroxyphenylpyruvate dioxygenase